MYHAYRGKAKSCLRSASTIFQLTTRSRNIAIPLIKAGMGATSTTAISSLPLIPSWLHAFLRRDPVWS
jgi:hypothetical protein